MPWARNPRTVCALKRRQSRKESHRRVEDLIEMGGPGGVAMEAPGL